MSRASIILVLFTFFTSLASGQWEADQFLFSNKESPARPKPIAIENKKTATNARPSKLIDKKNEPKKTTEPEIVQAPSDPLRDPASFEESTVGIDAKLGYIDFDSKSSSRAMDFNEGSTTVAAQLDLGIDPKNTIEVNYAGTAQIQSAVVWNGQSINQINWEDMNLAYSYRWFRGLNQIQIGPIFRQNNWWGQTPGKRVSLERLESFGLHGRYLFSKSERLRHQLQLQLLPRTYSLVSGGLGYDLLMDWTSVYDLTTGRALVFQLGAEQLKIKDVEDVRAQLDQRLIKVFVGYRVFTH
ncbi:MAG: hypothetical protein RJB66_2430 [Pseudomonadota bacterium]|jgi:hypothetical protein